HGIAVDSGGNVYIVGQTASLNFPTLRPYRSTLAGSNDVFVTKFNPAGNGLIFSTYLGGGGDDIDWGIAVDSITNVYITGQTESQNFPTTGTAVQTAPQGFQDAFLTKLGPGGSNLLYSTYFGGGHTDIARAVAVDNGGNAYFAGTTASIGTGNGAFPIAPQQAYQKNNAGGRDAFVAKINTVSGALVYSTFLGGASDEIAYGIAIDSRTDAYVLGSIAAQDNYPNPPTS